MVHRQYNISITNSVWSDIFITNGTQYDISITNSAQSDIFITNGTQTV